MNRDRPKQWRMAAPTDGQLALLARYGIDAPEGATQGEVSDMLDWCSELGSTYREHRSDFCYDCNNFVGECCCGDDDSFNDDLGPDSDDHEMESP